MKHFFYCLAALITLTSQFICADTITTEDGSILNGTITLVDKGIVHLETTYAGTLKLKQETVTAIETTSPLVVRLKNGTTTTASSIDAVKGDTIEIDSEGSLIRAQTDEIAAIWALGKTDPEIERNRRKWQNEFSVDITGRRGNVDQFSFGTALDMRLRGPIDELRFKFEYEQGEQNEDKTADRFLGRVGYERFNKEGIGWFVRSTLEQDILNDIHLRSTTSNGASYRIINSARQTLVLRNGFGFRYTDFESEDVKNESSLTIDLGLDHTYKYNELFSIENKLDYSPAIDDFNNFTAVQDSNIRIPITRSENFLIRMGIQNEYISQTSADEKLDTRYYTEFVYSWR